MTGRAAASSTSATRPSSRSPARSRWPAARRSGRPTSVRSWSCSAARSPAPARSPARSTTSARTSRRAPRPQRGAIGTLSVAGEYDQGPGGHLTVDVARGPRDRLASGGAVHLAGIVTGASRARAPKAGAAHGDRDRLRAIIGTPDCVFTTGTPHAQFAASVVNSRCVLTAGEPGPTGCDVFTPVDPGAAGRERLVGGSGPGRARAGRGCRRRAGHRSGRGLADRVGRRCRGRRRAERRRRDACRPGRPCASTPVSRSAPPRPSASTPPVACGCT